MSIYSSKRRHRASQCQIGHLKLSIYEESSALIVHIFEARGLLRDSGQLDAYVKLYLLPDPHKLTKEKTSIVKQRDPVFNQRFSFLLSEQDLERRLFISVWTHHTTSRNEMVGCMSFPIADLVGPNKGLNGWFHLLDEQKGSSENMKVPTSLSKYEGSLGYGFQKPGQQTFAVTLIRSKEGYGFNIHGHNPVYITSTVEGLPAQQMDIQVGDTILEVEGTDVTMADGQFVVSLVSKCPKVLHLVLQRNTSYRSRAATTATPYSSTQQDHAFLHPRRALYASQAPSGRRHSTPMHGLTQPTEFMHDDFYSQQLGIEVKGLESLPSRRGVNPGLMRQTVSGSNIGGATVVSNPAAMHPRRFSSVSEHFHPSLSQDQLMNDAPPSIIGPSTSTSGFVMSQPEDHVYDGFATAPRRSKNHRHRRTRKKYSLSQLEGEGGEGFHFTRAASLSPHHLVSNGASNYPHRQLYGSRETEVMSSNGSIAFSDSAYASGLSNQSTRGRRPPDKVDEYSRYLRPGKRQEEGGVSMANYQFHHGNRSDLDGFIRSTSEEEFLADWESVGPLDQKRQRAANGVMNAEFVFHNELKTGIKTYLEPLKHILPDTVHRTMFMNVEELCAVSEEIVEMLKTRRILCKSLDPTPTQFYFTEVADIYHTKLSKLVGGLERYRQGCLAARQVINETFTNEEFTKLVQESVVRERKPSIYSFIEAGKEYLSKLTRSMMAVNFFTPLWHEDHRYLTTIIHALLKLCPDRGLVEKWEKNQETMRSLKLCISFGPRVQPFHVVVPGRVLLHEGEATLIEKRRKRKIWLMLFSDILLLTRRQGKILTSIEPPIFLDRLLVQDINCSQATEFQIATTDTNLCRQIRVATPQEKTDWMQKLKERATGSLVHHRRRSGEKMRNLPIFDTPRRQLHVGTEDDDQVHVLSTMATIPEGSVPAVSAGGKEEGEMREGGGTPLQPPSPSGELHRATPRRRSL